jgi:membrane protease subunit HflK
MVDAHSSGQLLYLPLDKLIQQVSGEPSGSNAATNSSQANPSAPAAQSPSVNQASPSSQANEKRDVLRSRDRDLR